MVARATVSPAGFNITAETVAVLVISFGVVVFGELGAVFMAAIAELEWVIPLDVFFPHNFIVKTLRVVCKEGKGWANPSTHRQLAVRSGLMAVSLASSATATKQKAGVIPA